MASPVKIRDLPVVYYSAKRVPNPKPGGAGMPWYEYHAARNLIYETCKTHNTTGPMDQQRVWVSAEEPDVEEEDWGLGDKDPTYWIVDDQYNEEMYIYLQVTRPAGLTLTWLRSIVRTLRLFLPGWGVCVMGCGPNYAIVFADRLMVNGRAMRRCRNTKQALDTLRASLKKPKGP